MRRIVFALPRRGARLRSRRQAPQHHRRRSQADDGRRHLRDRRPRPRLATRHHLRRGWRNRRDRDQQVAIAAVAARLISATIPLPNHDSKGDLTMATGTVRLHRVLRTNPERIYRAFLDADAMAKWLPPYGFTGKVYHLDAKVGGTDRMAFPHLPTRLGHSFGGEYRELVPSETIRYTDSFDDPNLPGEMQTTVTLKKVSCGTDVTIVQEGIPEAIPVEMCYLGWQESLVQLANLVEPEIPG